MKQTCTKCDSKLDRNGRYCKSCHNSYMRKWRSTHPLTMDEKLAIKIIQLSYLVTYGREIKEDELQDFLKRAKQLEIVSSLGKTLTDTDKEILNGDTKKSFLTLDEIDDLLLGKN